MIFKLSDRQYAIIKWGVIILLPAISVLYAQLGKIWGFPLIEQVQGTIAALCTFLGVIFCISSVEYKKAQEQEAETKQEVIEEAPVVEINPEPFVIKPTNKEEIQNGIPREN